MLITLLTQFSRFDFKKVKPWPNSINFDILRASRQLFAVKYSQLISSDTFVINLDDTLINRNIKYFLFMK